MATRTAVRDLYGTAVLESTRLMQWSYETNEEYSSDGTWRFVETRRCWECNRIAPLGGNSCDNPKCDVTDLDPPDGPMMSYWYPLGIPSDSSLISEEDAAEALVDLPLCLVVVDEQYGLALTGGGMDLTWEIVEAFVTLGFLPPLDCARPPRMAGYKLTRKREHLLSACRGSAKFAIRRAKYLIDDINAVAKWCKEQA